MNNLNHSYFPHNFNNLKSFFFCFLNNSPNLTKIQGATGGESNKENIRRNWKTNFERKQRLNIYFS